MVYFLWHTVFLTKSVAFGYTQDQMMGYVFLVLFVVALVTSAPSNDNVGGEIASGDLSNYLLKPVGYLAYWFTRDAASKLLNLLFSLLELSLLFLFFQPTITFSSEPRIILVGVGLLLSSVLTFFFISKLIISVAFWVPENTWGLMFLVMVFMETLSGAIFPLNILPSSIRALVDLTPFPYLIYHPISVLVGNQSLIASLSTLIKSLIWLFLSILTLNFVWRKGLKAYSATGK
jgi:ABC-2 type transport system permease protein